MKAALLIGLALFFFSRLSRADEPADSYVELARITRLSERIEWQHLLHVHGGALATESDIGPSKFFISAQGRTDSEAELEATLRAFFLPQDPRDPDSHAACRFPARYAWLSERLGLQIAPVRCRALEAFTREMHARSLTLVFTSNFLASPASMFGHVFLRIGRERDAPASPDDTTLEFTADVDTKNPVVYAIKGIGGFFHGRFRYQHFSDKMAEYTSSQDREMWDYDLNLTPEEIRIFALHLWELKSAKVDYTYFTGNCAYRLLEILEAAAPRLDLVSHLKAVVFPQDAVSALLDDSGLVKGVRYLPSGRKRLKEEYEDLPIPGDKAPHLSHGPFRLDFGAGGDTQFHGGFATIGFRLALHDMNDPPNGQPELATVQFLDSRVRYSETHRSFTVDEMTFAEIMSLNPYGRFERLLSFRVRGFAERIHDTGCTTQDCFAHGADFAAGITLATKNERYAVFAMADAFFLFSPDFDGIGGSFIRAGIGPYAGVRARISPSLMALATMTVSYLPAEHLATTFDARGSLRACLSKDVAVGVQVRGDPLGFDASFESYLYF